MQVLRRSSCRNTHLLDLDLVMISTELCQFFDCLDWPDPQHFKDMVLLGGKG